MVTALNDFASKHNITFKDNNDIEIITDFEITAINYINDIFLFSMHPAFFSRYGKYLSSHTKKKD
jgi:hypothetical protein